MNKSVRCKVYRVPVAINIYEVSTGSFHRLLFVADLKAESYSLFFTQLLQNNSTSVLAVDATDFRGGDPHDNVKC